ncbi:hypothetical protein [Leeuwenhoekiella sp. MAR_2009_132]|uniref:hypothetical protein n=1 Tax=Leeuwenhoekiella sp. MAR_2009_132 TaxID=1392489 RepID=UPI00048E7FC4|nr:hypothetical protein [Leeuwenhoekiella sp. MAR_2009_132]
MKTNNILGVEKFELGTPGDGVMGAVLTEFTDIEVGSVVIEGSNSNETNIPTEKNDSYLTVDDTADPTTVTARLFGVTPAQQVILMGGKVGTVDDGDDEGFYMAPASKPSIYLSMKISGKEIKGKRAVLKIPFGKVNAREQGTITKNGLPAIDITITANTPVSEAGVQGSPYTKGFEDVV